MSLLPFTPSYQVADPLADDFFSTRRRDPFFNQLTPFSTPTDFVKSPGQLMNQVGRMMDNMVSDMNTGTGTMGLGQSLMPRSQLNRDIQPVAAILRADIRECPENFYVDIDLPGVAKEDLSVDVTDTNLTIKGQCSTETEEEDSTWHHRERHSGSVYRTIPLPVNANSREAKTYFQDGVLHVTFPKLADANIAGVRKLAIGDSPPKSSTKKDKKHSQNRNN